MPDSPFSLSPNPTTLHVTAPLRSTLYRIRYTIDHRQGLAALLGDVGLGKSTVMRYLWAEYSAQPEVAVLFFPTSQFPSAFGMARQIAAAFGVAHARSLLHQRELLERWLVAQYSEGRNVVIFLDEAQLLSTECLELARTLLNFETDTAKLVQVVMAGQLDLRDRLKQAKYKALASRIFAPCLMNRLTLAEMVGMLEARVNAAGIPWPFAVGAPEVIYDYSGGVPRTALRIAEMAYGLMGDLIDEQLLKVVVQSDGQTTAA